MTCIGRNGCMLPACPAEPAQVTPLAPMPTPFMLPCQTTSPPWFMPSPWCMHALCSAAMQPHVLPPMQLLEALAPDLPSLLKLLTSHALLEAAGITAPECSFEQVLLGQCNPDTNNDEATDTTTRKS
jgi:hypothetical protein